MVFHNLCLKLFVQCNPYYFKRGDIIFPSFSPKSLNQNQADFSHSRHPRDPTGENHSYLTTFRGINAPRSGHFKYKNNAQTLPIELQNNFEKGQKMTFLALEMAKITISRGQILTKNLNFLGHL